MSHKTTEELCVMTLNCDAKFEEPTCHGKNDITNLVNIHVSNQNSQNLHFARVLMSKE